MALGSTLHGRTPGSESKREEVERAIRDPLLRGSEALCSLLRYLADRSLDDPEGQVKEHQIATAVFAKPDNFDPRTDSTVRVQTSRLRAKLGEYYATAGATNPWQIEIPKGSYSVVFKPRANLQPAPLPIAPASAPPRRLPRLAIPIGIAALVAIGIAAWWSLYASRSATPQGAQTATAQFWGAILTSPEEPLVVFSNAEFVGRPETGIRYRKPDDPASQLFDQYTGLGEVFAVHNLDGVFDTLHRHFRLKRGRLLNWDDTKNRELIFVGSPSENLPLRDLPLNRDFSFGRSTSGPRAGDLGIVNLKPQAGEQSIYFGSAGLPITEDYALVELGFEGFAAQPVLLLAGTTTFGTQAAVEFVCTEDKLRQLAKRFESGGPMRAFSALLHVRVKGGVPLESSVVAFRRD
jgi:hypothetical protein